MKDRSVTVIVLSWNSASVVEEAVESALEQTAPEVRVMLVDNASADGSADVVESRFGGRVRVVRHAENLGYTGGYNAALSPMLGEEGEAPEFVLLLNPDVRLEPDFVARALEAFDDPRVGMVSGRLVRAGGERLDSTGQFLARSRKTIDRGYGAPTDENDAAAGPVLSVCGAAALYRVAMLRDVADESNGGTTALAHDYFAFNEDLELGWRAWRAGWRAHHEPRAVAVHLRASGDEGGAFGLTFKRPPHVTAHIVKNRWLAMLRHDRIGAIVRDLPWIAARDLALAALVTVTRPVVWREIWRARGSFATALRQRRADRTRQGAWGAWRRDVPPRGVWRGAA